MSFHFLQKEKRKGDEDPVVIPFSQGQFDHLCSEVTNQPNLDLTDEKILHQVRNGTLVPFFNVNRVNSRTLTGQFRVPYSGHSFLNSDKGKIEAQSVNQRNFHFILYLSDDGRFFIGAQYLGNYGGYETLRYGLVRYLPERAGVRSYSFRRDFYDPSDIHAKEVRIDIVKQSDSFEHDNSLIKRSVIVLKREGRSDTHFENAVRKEVIPILTSDMGPDDRKTEIAKVLSDSGLISIADDEIENAIMVADVHGREKTFHLVGDSAFATRFPLDVPFNVDGHPEPKPTIEEMLGKLDKEVIEYLS